MIFKQEPDSKEIELKLLQRSKADTPIVSQEAGIEILVNDEQPLNEE